MMKFAEFPYHRIDLDHLCGRLEEQSHGISAAKTFGECFYHLIQSDLIDRVFTSYAVVSEARYTHNTRDAFYAEEEAFFSQAKPFFALRIQQRNEALCASRFRQPLSELLGDEFFNRALMQGKAISEQVLSLMDEENDLSQSYSQIMSNLSVQDGKTRRSLSEIGRRMNHPDRQIRRHYNSAYEQTLLGVAPELDSLFDRLSRVRTRIAEQLEFSSYTDLCLHKHARTSYRREDLAIFAGEVERHVVPVVQSLINKQRRQLGHPVMNYDEDVLFPGKTVQMPESPLAAFRQIFSDMSAQTGVFYDELSLRAYHDLTQQEGKLQGAYSNFMPLAGMPYIFESYNATPGAFQTFAHECGHGLHAFLHRGDEVQGLNACSSDVLEIHSMSMEFFIWPYLHKVMEAEDLPYYFYRQLKNCLAFIPYGTAIDCFQTEVYDHPEMSCEERLMLWKELEKRFLPWRSYEPGGFFDQGRAWQKQIHVMKWPFYYIDYVLAQIGALQFWMMDRQNHQQAWEAYLKLIQDSGRYPFVTLLQRAGLRSPFEEGVLPTLCRDIQSFLGSLSL